MTSEFPPQIGGIATHVYELTRHLAMLDNEIAVFVPKDGEMPSVRGVTVLRSNYRLSGWPFFDIQLASWLRRRVAAERPDVIHVHGMKPLGGTHACGIPVVFTNHTSGFLKRLGGSNVRKTRTLRRIEHAAAVIAPSRTLLDAVRTIGYTGPGHYVSNGVDTDRFAFDGAARSRLRGQWNVRGEPVVLLASRLVPVKGGVDFSQAMALLTNSEFRVVIAGDGPERGEMERIFESAGLIPRVRFLGFVANDRMPEIYSAADLAVLPSHMEATSISGLEAMSCGLCLVGTRIGGIPEIVSDGESGALVPARNPVELSKTVKALLDNPDRRRRLGEAARARAESGFSWSSVARRTLDILYEAANL